MNWVYGLLAVGVFLFGALFGVGAAVGWYHPPTSRCKYCKHDHEKQEHEAMPGWDE